MLDFITVSNTPAKVAGLERSIRSTFTTVAWKLHIVDGKRYDIYSGYNAGAAVARGDLLVFVHDDVVWMSNEVAMQRPFSLLAQPSTGIVGVCGATRLNAHGTWMGDMPVEKVEQYCRGAVGCPDTNSFGMGLLSWPRKKALFGQVLVVDGVLLMCHRRTFDRLGGFDDKRLKGFHFYDLDISLRAHLAGLRNYVAPIPLYHASEGNYDQAWNWARMEFLRVHAGRLPINL